MAESPHERKPAGHNPLGEKIGRRAERKRRSREQDKPTAWFGLGMFGLVGWSVAIPSLIGIAVGLWLDARWPGLPSWTLTFLIIGVGLGCLNAWYWIKQESRDE
ncbi:MAG: AtpZ/AtpI family protein [Gammaproteobacteria bacterium]|nr:AtpZ/AtpI family protein [Gammaproteobacteria bacterium]MCW8839783.1 AtpZ/AtpI family protein [Gammaproteobacteria bacterium]MCW8928061.1 AtpZ/AtpI family protein [Gammaproteobacteria bacterium]MCW8957760.1 AtpZ/AtpI family protein [Gammaproteobacteria bacterium]MCW8972498.1 AtpZ/AtpI family protein [Gammaproteobacteria bacterium]